MVAVGLAITGLPVVASKPAAGDHIYVLVIPPLLTVKVAESYRQMGSGETVIGITGKGFTVITIVSRLRQVPVPML